jgi:hypothetical protein
MTIRSSGGRKIGTITYDPDNTQGLYEVGALRLKKGDNAVEIDIAEDVVLDAWRLMPVDKLSNGVEGEDLAVVPTTGVDVTEEWTELEWSGAGQVRAIVPAGEAVRFKLPVSRTGWFEMTPIVTKGPESGLFQLLVDGQPLGQPHDLRADERMITELPAVPVELARDATRLSFENRGPRTRLLQLDAVRLIPIASPHAIECEALEVIEATFDDYHVQHIGGASRAGHLWCRAQAPGERITLAVPVPAPGRYRLGVVLTRSFDYGIVQMFVNDKPIGAPIDTFDELRPGPVTDLGVVNTQGDSLRLSAQVVGKNEKSPGYFFGLDCVILEPVEGSTPTTQP